MLAMGSCMGSIAAESGLIIIRSAFIPGLSAPISSSQRSAFAPFVVAIVIISSALTTVGSSLQPLCISDVTYISSIIVIRLLAEAPSVPIDTHIPFLSILGIFAKPRTLMAEAGLWETFTSYSLNISTSSSVSHTVWTARRFLSKTPRFLKWVTVGTPLVSFTYSTSAFASATCMWIPTLYLSASSFVPKTSLSESLKSVLKPNHTLTRPSYVLFQSLRSCSWTSSSSCVERLHTGGRLSP